MTTAIQARLLARSKKLLNQKSNHVVKPKYDHDKSFMITSYQKGSQRFDTITFKDITEITNYPIFTGCLHEGVSFVSILNLSVKPGELEKLTSVIKKYTFSVHPTNTPAYVRVLLPLNRKINNSIKFDECLKALNSVAKTNISQHFDEDVLFQLKPATQINLAELFDATTFLKVVKAEKTSRKAEKNKRKLEAIKQGVYTVKRLSNEATASQNSASLKNVSSFKFTGFLKAPFTIQQLKDYSTEPSISAILAKGIGVPDKVIKSLKGVSTSSNFKCILTGGQAQLFIADNNSQYSGKVTYKILSTGERLSIHEVYARLLTQRSDLNKPTLMCYLLKLLDDCGLIIRNTVKIEKPTDHLTNAEKSVFEGFKQLAELKYCIKGQENDPIVFTKTFAAMWSNVSRITATKAINKLIEFDIIQLADEIQDYAAYKFYEVISKATEAIKDKAQAYAEKLSQYSPNKLDKLLKQKESSKNMLIQSVLKQFESKAPIPR